MKPSTTSDNLSTEEAVLHCMAYFDIFKHPLRSSEVLDFLSISSDKDQVQLALDSLMNQGTVELNEGLFSIRKSQVDITLRQTGEARASNKMDHAIQYGKKIGSFPFVQGVLISGSLSKGVLHEDADYDFFLIIKNNKLWISKLILKMYKLFFLGNSYEYFCINYLISDDALEIKEKNVFTATELLTAIPISCKASLFSDLKTANGWVTDYLPNKNWRPYIEHIPDKHRVAKLLQGLLDNPIGSMIDRLIMSLTIMRNKIKYRKLADKSIFNNAFKSTRTESKVHPNNTQKTVLETHKEKISYL